MKTLRLSKFGRFLAVSFLATASVVIACIGDKYDSVHFYTGWFHEPRPLDFGRVPQEVMVSGWNLEPVRGAEFYETGIPPAEEYSYADLASDFVAKPDDEYYIDEYASIRQAVHSARNLEGRGRYKEALDKYREHSGSLAMQSFIRDREELLASGLTSRSVGFREYLRERYLIEFGGDPAKPLAALKALKVDKRLESHIAYVAASNSHEVNSDVQAKAFLDIAAKFPNSLRCESALVMAGRVYCEAVSGQYADETEFSKGIKIFDDLLRRFPKTRFRWTIDGWKGSRELRQNHFTKAVTFYVRQSKSPVAREAWKGHQSLALIAMMNNRRMNAVIHWLKQRSLPVDNHLRMEAARQIRNTLGGFNAQDAKDIQKLIKGDPQLLCAYLDFRLEDSNVEPKDERKLLAYISASMRKANRVDKGTYARIAQIQYSAGRYGAAISMARRAQRDKGDVGARARYILAASFERLGRHAEAIRTYESLYRSKTKDYIRKSTAEHLALLHEKYGNPERAFELYHDIDYKDDLAYVADSLLTPRQLRRVIGKVHSKEEQNGLTYTLAMRYFRVGNYERAEKILEQMPKELRLRKGLSAKGYKDFDDGLYFEVNTEKKIDPLEDVRKMKALRRREQTARTREQRAEALYAMAQYARQRRNLMFYSPAIWRGARAWLYGLFWNEKINKGKSEAIALRSAMEHECLAQTMTLCEELIEKYPRSRLVPKALYTAAVSAEHVSRFNSWWNTHRLPLVRKSIRYLKRLERRYPSDPLAKDARKYAEEFAEELKPDYYR